MPAFARLVKDHTFRNIFGRFIKVWNVTGTRVDDAAA